MEQHNNKYSITLNDEVVFLIKDNNNNNNNNNNYNTINNNENNENNNNNKPKLYKRRYLALVLFCLLTMFQSNVWMTYSSVADTAMDIYGIGKSQINMLAAFGAIAFIPLSFLSSWAIDNLGLRKSTVIAAVAVGGGAVVRSLAVRDSLFALVYIGQFANAAAGPILMTTSPVLSAAWFGPHERTLATGLCTTANNMGIPIGFLISTFVSTRKQFFYMLWIEAAAAVMITILIILFVVDKPPSPPSFSKQINSVNQKISMIQFLKDTWKVLSDRNCFILIMAVTFTAGGNAGWSSMLIMILTPLKFNQNQAQWIGFISGSIGLIGGIFIGKFHDKYKSYKWILIVLFLVSTLGYLYFTLATTSILLQFYTTPYWAMLLVITVGNFCLNALYPIGYEALSELSFPVSETVGSGTLSLMINIGCLIYLIFGDYVPISWNNYILVGCCGFACTITLFLKEQYKRLSVDDKMH